MSCHFCKKPLNGILSPARVPDGIYFKFYSCSDCGVIADGKKELKIAHDKPGCRGDCISLNRCCRECAKKFDVVQVTGCGCCEDKLCTRELYRRSDVQMCVRCKNYSIRMDFTMCLDCRSKYICSCPPERKVGLCPECHFEEMRDVTETYYEINFCVKSANKTTS